MDCSTPSFLVHHQLPLKSAWAPNSLKLMSLKLMMPSNHLILCRPLLLTEVLTLPCVLMADVSISLFFASCGVVFGGCFTPSVGVLKFCFSKAGFLSFGFFSGSWLEKSSSFTQAPSLAHLEPEDGMSPALTGLCQNTFWPPQVYALRAAGFFLGLGSG